MYDGMNLYRAVVSYASSTTGDINVRIPAILGPTEVLPISKIGRAAVDGAWQVPLLGSQVVVAIEDDRFSNVYMVYPNLAVISASSGGPGPEPEPEPEPQAIPSGSIMQYAGATAPDGWLFCRGQSLSKTGTYANLFAAIGYSYGGSGDSFLLPNLQGKLPVGFNSADTKFNSLSNQGGSQTRSLVESNLPAHSHSLNSHTHTLSHTHSISHTHDGSTNSDSHDHGGISTSGAHRHNVPFFVGVYTAGGTGTGPVGAGGTSNVLTVSGEGGHTHSISSDSHNHTVSTTSISTSTSGAASTSTTSGPSTTSTGNGNGTGSSFEILPPYIVVNYIIKV